MSCGKFLLDESCGLCVQLQGRQITTTKGSAVEPHAGCVLDRAHAAACHQQRCHMHRYVTAVSTASTQMTGCVRVQWLVGLPTAAQVAHLRPLRSAAVHAGVLDAAGGAELVRLLLDLHRQLSRGRQAQHNWAIARLCATALRC